MRESRRCPKCAHHEIIFIPSVRDDVGEGSGTAMRIATARPNESWTGLARNPVGLVSACICRKCGFTELYTKYPGDIPIDEIKGAELLVGTPDQPYR